MKSWRKNTRKQPWVTTRPWVTNKILDLCDQRRDLKKAKNTRKGAEAYREISKKIRKEKTEYKHSAQR